jgi:putative ABC transport system permease protein
MRTVRRSLLNILRSPARSVVVVIILAVSLGLALIMFEVHAATATQLSSIGGNVGNDITVRPAGYFGFGGGGGNPLPQAQVDQLNSLAHVASVQETVQTTYTGTALVSGIDVGSLGFFRSFDGSRPPADATPVQVPNSSGMPSFANISVMGVSPSAATPTLMGGGTMTMESGRYFTSSDAGADVAVVGTVLATKNSLTVGSEITIGTDQVQVIGIYTSGQQFGDNMLIMPISTVQRLYSIDGATSITVATDNQSNVDTVITEIRGIWDTNTADVVSAQQEYARISGSITSAGSSSQTGMLVAFIVAAVIVLLSVILVIRQRIREIGIMKAIGASNWQIGFQFGLETTVMTVAATIVGVVLSILLGQQVANLFNSGNTAGGFGGGRAAMFGAGGGRIVRGTIGGIHVAVSPEVLLIAFVSAVVLAIAASIIPVWYIARVRPAEVLRNE